MHIKTITVVYGEEKYCPVQFQSFTVGPFSMTVEIGPEEDISLVTRRVYERLEAVAAEVRERKTKEFLGNLRGVLEVTKGYRG